jgi:hypothetical protein
LLHDCSVNRPSQTPTTAWNVHKWGGGGVKCDYIWTLAAAAVDSEPITPTPPPGSVCIVGVGVGVVSVVGVVVGVVVGFLFCISYRKSKKTVVKLTDKPSAETKKCS